MKTIKWDIYEELNTEEDIKYPSKEPHLDKKRKAPSKQGM